MSTEAASASALQSNDPVNSSDQIECKKPLEPSHEPTFLHSPPDSNNAEKSNASESELSDLEDEPSIQLMESARAAEEELVDESKPQEDVKPVAEPEEDIGEVEPEFWSGGVPVFKPTMDQFKDFQKFVGSLCPAKKLKILTLFCSRWQRLTSMV